MKVQPTNEDVIEFVNNAISFMYTLLYSCSSYIVFKMHKYSSGESQLINRGLIIFWEIRIYVFEVQPYQLSSFLNLWLFALEYLR